jgi:hypothetical protein
MALKKRDSGKRFWSDKSPHKSQINQVGKDIASVNQAK